MMTMAPKGLVSSMMGPFSSDLLTILVMMTFMRATVGHLAGDGFDFSCVNMEDETPDVLALAFGAECIPKVLHGLHAVILEFVGDISELKVLLSFWKVSFQTLDDIILRREFFFLFQERTPMVSEHEVHPIKGVGAQVGFHTLRLQGRTIDFPGKMGLWSII